MSVSWCYRPGWWHVRMDGSQICLPLHVIDQVDEMWGNQCTNMAHTPCHWPGWWHVREPAHKYVSLSMSSTWSMSCVGGDKLTPKVDYMCEGRGGTALNWVSSPCHQPGQWHVRRAKLTNMSPSACHWPGRWHVWEERQLSIRPPLHVINQVNDMCWRGRQACNRSPLCECIFFSPLHVINLILITSVGVAFHFLSSVGDCCWSVLGALCNPWKP